MLLDDYVTALAGIETIRSVGQVVELTGLLAASDGPMAAVGDFCEIQSRAGRAIRAQVIGFREGRVLLMPLEETGGLQLGDTVVARPEAARVKVGAATAGARARRIRKTDGWRTRDRRRKPATICTRRRPGRLSASTSPSAW